MSEVPVTLIIQGRPQKWDTGMYCPRWPCVPRVGEWVVWGAPNDRGIVRAVVWKQDMLHRHGNNGQREIVRVGAEIYIDWKSREKLRAVEWNTPARK